MSTPRTRPVTTEPATPTGNLQALFSPRSVAVIGASHSRLKLGHIVLRNVRESGYPGPIYPVNPKGGRIEGLTVYPSIEAVPGPVDLAIVVVPSDAVLPVVQGSVRKRVRAVIVITAGFRETGPTGAATEKAIAETAAAAGVRLLGPNSLGIIDTTTPLDASFAAQTPLSGDVAFMSQSGALCTAILDWARPRGLGFSKFVSLGNEANVTETDLLDLWQDDPRVRVIAAYLEGVANGSRFRAVASAVTRRRPVVVLKAGRTHVGAGAVTSHTGTLAGSDVAYSTAFREAGIIRANTTEELFDVAMALASQPLPPGRNLTIITNAGGPGIIATDAAAEAGLQLTTLSPATVTRLRQCLPPAASVRNPIDLLGDAGPDRYRVALDTALADPHTSAVLVILTSQQSTDAEATARVIVEALNGANRPVLTSFMGSSGVKTGVAILNTAGIPNFPFPERAVTALAAMANYAAWRLHPVEKPRHVAVDQARAQAIIERASASGQPLLDSFDAAQVVHAYGIPVPRGGLAHTPEEAVRLADEIGFPVVLKVVSPHLAHKSDVGGVKLRIKSAGDVRRAYAEILESIHLRVPNATIEGIAVWQTAPPGLEAIVGLSTDPTFGHLLMFGLGGIYVEALKDVSFRLIPVTPGQATAMIEEIRGYPILAGIRGQPPADLSAIADVIERVSQLATDFPVVRELDLNPLIVYPDSQGVLAVDVRLILSV